MTTATAQENPNIAFTEYSEGKGHRNVGGLILRLGVSWADMLFSWLTRARQALLLALPAF